MLGRDAPPRLPGIRPPDLQEILGYSSVTLTLGTYSHVLSAVRREAAEQLDAILAS